jgi:hypothetical protein
MRHSLTKLWGRQGREDSLVSARPVLSETGLTYFAALVCKRTTPTERQPLVGEVSANFWGQSKKIYDIAMTEIKIIL